MIINDPISDLLTRIRNASMVNKHQVNVPHSIIKQKVAEVLKNNRFITKVSVSDEDNRKYLNIEINSVNENPRFTELKRVSKPGRKVYVSSQKIPVVKQGRGIVILTTPKGILTGAEAKKQNVGGEVLCTVY